MLRNHYVPQYYLSGFSAPDGKIYRYEKGRSDTIRLGLINAAVEKGFYSDELEAELNDKIETPANALLDQLRQGQMIAEHEKTILAAYMSNLMRRTPRAWARAQNIIPRLIPERLKEIEEKVRTLIRENPHQRNQLENQWAKVVKQTEIWEKTPPRDPWYYTLQLKRNDRVTETLRKLVWVFYASDRPIFLTSDNPVYYPEHKGIGSAGTVVHFPISSTLALEATNLVSSSTRFYQAYQEKVNEINRHIVQAATRYIFHCEEAQWVLDLMNQMK